MSRVFWWLGVRFPEMRLWYFKWSGEWLWGTPLFVDEMTPMALEAGVQRWLVETEEIGRMINTALNGRQL